MFFVYWQMLNIFLNINELILFSSFMLGIKLRTQLSQVSLTLYLLGVKKELSGDIGSKETNVCLRICLLR